MDLFSSKQIIIEDRNLDKSSAELPWESQCPGFCLPNCITLTSPHLKLHFSYNVGWETRASVFTKKGHRGRHKQNPPFGLDGKSCCGSAFDLMKRLDQQDYRVDLTSETTGEGCQVCITKSAELLIKKKKKKKAFRPGGKNHVAGGGV